MSEPVEVEPIELEDEPWRAPMQWHERLGLTPADYYARVNRVCGPEYRMALEGRPMT